MCDCGSTNYFTPKFSRKSKLFADLLYKNGILGVNYDENGRFLSVYLTIDDGEDKVPELFLENIVYLFSALNFNLTYCGIDN